MIDPVNKEYYINVFDTRLGWVGVLASPAGLLCVALPQATSEQVLKSFGSRAGRAIPSPASLADITERLRRYFSGQRVDFPDRLDLSEATSFQAKVWEATRHIPFGETRSYSWVAAEIGKPSAVRAVGQALGSNPFPVVVPCHRVLGSDGRLCGFAGGLEMKKYLLKLES